MKKAHLIFLFLFSIILTTFVLAEDKRDFGVVPKENRYALLVGINDYNKPFTSLKYCDADMEALENVLLSLGFLKENIVRLSTSAKTPSRLPTKSNIIHQAELLTSSVDENGMLLVAFSGHGASYGDESFFCPMDSVNKNLGSLLKCSDLYNIVEICPAKQKLVFVDACRNSLVMDGWKGTEGMKDLVDPVGIENPGFFIISSCKNGQHSWEDKELGHGVFTHFLVEGLQGKAAQESQISVHSLFSYVNKKTKDYVRVNFDEEQNPLMRGNEDELDDFLLAKVIPQDAGDDDDDDDEGGKRKVLTVDGIDYAFRWCPAGEFTMGSRNGYSNEKPTHTVYITLGFWLLETEVTQEIWQSVMGTNPSSFKGEKYPVENVSWEECQIFCQKLSEKLGHQIHLPTEAQWEYACHAGTPGDYAGELDELGWYNANSESKTHPVGVKKPNEWGLLDMHGNVWEWCSDWLDEKYYTDEATRDPSGPPSGSTRVYRGGGWNSDAEFCRSTYRGRSYPENRDSSRGLRILFME